MAGKPLDARHARLRVLGALGLALVLPVLAACAPAPVRTTAALSPLSPLPAATATPGPLALTIVHSNDSWGYLDPCG